MTGDLVRVGVEDFEAIAQRGVALLDGAVEPVVCGGFLRDLPDALDSVQLWRVRRQPVKLNPMPVLREPRFAVRVEVVAWTVVDDEEYLPAAAATNEVLQEAEERDGIKDRRELVDEKRSRLNGDDAVHMGRLAHTERVDARLLADAGPGTVQGAVEPEACFVAERYDAPAGCRFFLIAGKVVRNQLAWRSTSARARRLRGRCTEKPN